MRQIRHSVASPQASGKAIDDREAEPQVDVLAHQVIAAPDLVPVARQSAVAIGGSHQSRAEHLQRQAWQWALKQRLATSELPTGEAIAEAFQPSPRWGRLVKNAGLRGRYDQVEERRAAQFAFTPGF